MPRLNHRLPRYCRHKATDRACVYLLGKAHYLGPYNSPESKRRYQALIRDYLANSAPTDGSQAPPSAVATGESAHTTTAGPASVEPAPRPVRGSRVASPSVNEVILAYWDHAKSYYLDPEGRPSRELDNIRDALRPVRERFGDLAAEEFRPNHLRAIQQELRDRGLITRTINARIRRIRRCWNWAAGREIIGLDVADRLGKVDPVRAGRGGADRPPVRPVEGDRVLSILPHLPPMIAAMVQVQIYTGIRPGELTRLATSMVDRSGDVWSARLPRHKNSWRGQAREVLIGPRAQECLGPWLLPGDPDAPIFSPRRVDDRQPKRGGQRRPGPQYSRSAYSQCIRRACLRAGVEPFSPNALRHNCGTHYRDQAGLEAAQVVLGHSRPDTTLI